MKILDILPLTIGVIIGSILFIIFNLSIHISITIGIIASLISAILERGLIKGSDSYSEITRKHSPDYEMIHNRGDIKFFRPSPNTTEIEAWRHFHTN